MLEGVDQEQQRSVAQHRREYVKRRPRSRLLNVEGAHNGRWDQGCITQRCEVDEVGSIREALGKCRGALDSEPSLADATRPRQRDEPHALAEQQPTQARQVVFPPDQRVRLCGQTPNIPAARSISADAGTVSVASGVYLRA